MNITFKDIKIEGFASYLDETRFCFDNPGIKIIKGQNGAGKTTLFSALLWCLYGKVLKNIKIENIPTFEHLRNNKWRGTRVNLSFTVYNGEQEDEYEICRHIAYKGDTHSVRGGDRLIILKNGEIVNEALHKDDQQKYINNIISMDDRIFLNTVLFGQKMSRLISSSAEEKRRLFEEIFDLSFIDDAKNKCKDKIITHKAKISEINGRINQVKVQISICNNDIKNNESRVEDFEKSKQIRISKIKKKLNEVDEDIAIKNVDFNRLKSEKKSEVPSAEGIIKRMRESDIELNAIKTEYATVVREIDKINHYIKANKESISEHRTLINSLEKVCPTCGSPISEEKKSELLLEYENKIFEYEANIFHKEREIQNFFVREAELNTKKVLQESKHKKSVLDYSKLNEIAEDKASYDRALDRVKVVLDNLNENRNKILEDLSYEESQKVREDNTSELLLKIKEHNDNIIEISKELEYEQKYLSYLELWRTDGFSNSGIKKYVFSKMFESLNEQCEKYSKKLGFLVKFGFDINKLSKNFFVEIYRNGNTVDYNTLSGGEQQKVDICAAFALHDLISSKTNVNILIFDELLESIDDSGGTEQVFELVRSKLSLNKTIYIITHLSNIDTLYTKELNISNNGGSSKIN